MQEQMYKDAIRALEDAQQILLLGRSDEHWYYCGQGSFITSKVTKAVYPSSTHHFITHIISLPFISMTHVVCIEIIIIRALYGRTSEEGQPPNNGQNAGPHHVHCSEVPLY